VSRLSPFGLLELSRQRIRSALSEKTLIQCEHCEGTGLVKSTESAALNVLRQVRAGLARGGCTRVRVDLPDEVAHYLLNQKREELFRLEKVYGLKIQIAGQPGLPYQRINIDFSRKEASRPERPSREKKEAPPSSQGHPERVSPEEADRLAIEELKKETKESLLKKFLWPPSLWRGIRKSSPPPAPPEQVPPVKGPTEGQEPSEPPKKWEDLL
jgi:ribonuclease E